MHQAGYSTEVMSDVQDVYRAFFESRPTVRAVREPPGRALPHQVPLDRLLEKQQLIAGGGEKWNRLHSTAGFF